MVSGTRLRTATPESDRYFAAAGFPVVTDGFSPVLLKPWSERSRSSFQISVALGPRLMSISGAKVFPLLPPSLGQTFVNRPVDVILQSSGGFSELADVAGLVYQRLQADPLFQFPDTDLKLD